jgi:hypothetical protein
VLPEPVVAGALLDVVAGVFEAVRSPSLPIAKKPTMTARTKAPSTQGVAPMPRPVRVVRVSSGFLTIIMCPFSVVAMPTNSEMPRSEVPPSDSPNDDTVPTLLHTCEAHRRSFSFLTGLASLDRLRSRSWSRSFH